MPKKRYQSVLGLPPLPHPGAAVTGTDLVAYNPGRAITPREQAIGEEWHIDKLIITALDDKAQYGLEQTNAMKWFAVTDVGYTWQQIEGVRQEAQGTGYQVAMDEFCKYMMALSARHTLGIVEVSASQIAAVVGESVVPPSLPVPESPKGFFARLFGG